MKNILKIAAFVISILVGSNVYADTVTNNGHSALQVCADNQYKFYDSVRRIGDEIQRRSVFQNPNSGDITYESTRVWDRDIRMITHYFSVDFNAVTHSVNATVGRCNNVINFYSRCVDELYDNVTAKVSVRRPTTGCLGRLYDTYKLTDEDYYHGR